MGKYSGIQEHALLHLIERQRVEITNLTNQRAELISVLEMVDKADSDRDFLAKQELDIIDAVLTKVKGEVE